MVTVMVMSLRYESNVLFPGGKCVINAEMHIVNVMRINFYEHARQDLHSRFMSHHITLPEVEGRSAACIEMRAKYKITEMCCRYFQTK